MSPVTVAASAADQPSDASKAEPSPPVDSKPATVTIVVDPDGNLYLDTEPVDNRPYRFRVCSGAFHRQSPVWKAMLFGPWSESKPSSNNGEKWIVQLPEDPTRPMSFILRMIHGRFDIVPDKIGLGDLYDILVLTKYDMTGIARPWCAQWIGVARGMAVSKPTTSGIRLSMPDMVKSLYVARELGDEKLFAHRLRDLAVQSRMGKDGRLSYAAASVSSDNKEPASLNDEDILGPHDALGTLCLRRQQLDGQWIRFAGHF